MSITFNDCLQEHYSKEGSIRFSKKVLRQLSFGIKLLYDTKHPYTAQYLQTEENGVSMQVRLYPDAFKKTIVGIIEKNNNRILERRRMIEELNSLKSKNKPAVKIDFRPGQIKLRKRKNKPNPVYSAKPKQL